MTANGLQFTVTGLDSNTQYGYNLTAKDANDQPVATYSGDLHPPRGEDLYPHGAGGEVKSHINNSVGTDIQGGQSNCPEKEENKSGI